MGDRSLATLLLFMADAVRRRDALSGSPDMDKAIERIVAPSARGMSPSQRLDVYREQFWSRHLGSLRDDFPTLIWVLGGQDRFRDLAGEYLLAHPPDEWDLQRLGKNLSSYVSAHPPWCDDRLARDAAQLDWAFMEAFDAPDALPFDPGVLASTREEAWSLMRVTFHPSLRTLALAYPAHDLREGVKRGDARVRPDPAESRVVVWRDGACVLRTACIEPGAAQLLDALRAGVPLGAACETIAQSTSLELSELEPRLANWFQHWTSSGWVSSISVDG